MKASLMCRHYIVHKGMRPELHKGCVLGVYLLVCSRTFIGVTGGLEWASSAVLKDKLETEAGGLGNLPGVARPVMEGVRLHHQTGIRCKNYNQPTCCLPINLRSRESGYKGVHAMFSSSHDRLLVCRHVKLDLAIATWRLLRHV